MKNYAVAFISFDDKGLSLEFGRSDTWLGACFRHSEMRKLDGSVDIENFKRMMKHSESYFNKWCMEQDFQVTAREIKMKLI